MTLLLDQVFLYRCNSSAGSKTSTNISINSFGVEMKIEPWNLRVMLKYSLNLKELRILRLSEN